jgi:serine/threonine-protein kinase
MPAFGSTEADRASELDAYEDHQQADENDSPLPISTPSAEGEDELPSVIKPGVELLNRKYKVIKKLGQGGMGAVWLVEHKELGQKRALKLIHDNYAADKQVRKRFRREAQILASLRHPNAVLVYDYDFIGKVPYIDMEYLKGEPLRKRLKPGVPLPTSTIVWILEELQKVLDLAHALKIVHRDLKPENIMIVEDSLSGREELKVLDFGIAKIVQQGTDENLSLTMDTQGLLGTLAYASPEQNSLTPEHGPLKVDHRSDIYSVGVMLFEMLTGQRPFLGGPTQLLFQHSEVPPPSFQKVAPKLTFPPAVEAAVRRCLEKDPANRPGSLAELLRDFRHAVKQSDTYVEPTIDDRRGIAPGILTNGRKVATEPATQSTAIVPDVVRRRLPGWAGILAGLLAGTVLVWFMGFRDTGKDTRKPPPPELPPAIKEYLAKRGFQPVSENELLDGWPTALRKSGGETRTWKLHGKIYLPEDYQPETEEYDHGLPQFVKGPHGVRFVLIRGGFFVQGAFDNDLKFEKEEKPPRRVTLSTFYIQRTETSIGEFDRYCGKLSPGDRGELKSYDQVRAIIARRMAPEELAHNPVAGVSHRQAVRYAHDNGGELPTEAQWEFAARSLGKPLRFVWGNNEYKEGVRANLQDLSGIPVPVHEVGDSDGDLTEQQVCDLAGNVREWCRDVWRKYEDNREYFDPVETPAEGQRDAEYVIRGGSYLTPIEMSRTTYRSSSGQVPYRAKEDDPIDDVGFRLVIEVLATEDFTALTGAVPEKRRESAR